MKFISPEVKKEAEIEAEDIKDILQRKDDKEVNKRIKKKIRIIRGLPKKLKNLRMGGNERLTLAATLARLVIELEEKLVDYDTILSDEISARLFSLFLKHLIDKKRQEANQEKAQIYFIASGRYRSEKQLREIENFIKEEKNKFGKVLVATEYIETGRSIAKLIDILEKQGVDFDVAAVSIKYDPLSRLGRRRYQDQKNLLKRLKYGLDGLHGQTFHHRRDLAGVAKVYLIKNPGIKDLAGVVKTYLPRRPEIKELPDKAREALEKILTDWAWVEIDLDFLAELLDKNEFLKPLPLATKTEILKTVRDYQKKLIHPFYDPEGQDREAIKGARKDMKIMAEELSKLLN